MVENVKLRKDRFTVSFLSSSFTATWNFSIKNDIVTINPKWTTAIFEEKNKKIYDPNYKNYESPIVVGINLFIKEWEKLLIEVREDLKKVGYGKEIEGFDYLERLPC